MHRVATSGSTELFDDYCRQACFSLADVEWLAEAQVPQPYRRLLVHRNDMTVTLEQFHKCEVKLQVLNCECDSLHCLREVVLRRQSDSAPVEYGLICIHLEPVPAESRESIRCGRKPLGAILRDAKIAHLGRLTGAFRVTASARIQTALGCQASVLYGRRNALLTDPQNVLAEIVEILPVHS